MDRRHEQSKISKYTKASSSEQFNQNLKKDGILLWSQ